MYCVCAMVVQAVERVREAEEREKEELQQKKEVVSQGERDTAEPL